MPIRHRLITIICTLTLVYGMHSPLLANNRDREVNVVTYNMYLGTDFSGIFGSQTLPQLASEVGAAYADVQASNPAARIDEIADQIAAASPSLVGLQEVALWRTGTLGDPAPATTVTYDFLQMLLDELASRGLHYEAVAVQTNLDAELPAAGSGVFADVRFTDRVVILARTDLRTSQLKIEGSGTGTFETLFGFTAVFGPVTVQRGWTSVDVKMRGKTFRFINAHLESFHPLVNYLQGVELLQGPAATSLPVVLVGDLNSDAEAGEATYLQTLAAGFTDAWRLTNPNGPGRTWPLFLTDPWVFTDPTQRIDLILTRGGVYATSADVIGEDRVADITAFGLRPSDHAGVRATVVLRP